MEVVKLFNSELSSLYEAKPPISKAKMTSITRTAIKAIKFYKHVVQSVEKFIQKCKPEYKVPGLYVIDSIVRQSRHQFGTEKDVFAPRFARNLQTTFIHLFNCPPEDKSKVIRVLNLWQKNTVFESDVIQPLFDLADPNHPIHKEQPVNNIPSNGITASKPSVNTPKTSASINKSSSKDSTTGWVNQLSHNDTTSSSQTTPLSSKHTPAVGQQSVIDVNLIQQLQQLQTLLDQRTDNSTPSKKESDQIKFDKKLLDFDYGEEEDEDAGTGTGSAIPALTQSHSVPTTHHQQQQQVSSSLDSLGSILSNPEVLRQLQNLQVQLNQQQLRQQYESEEKMRKLQEMRQQEEEFDKHLAQTVPNLPFADQCDFKPNQDMGSSMSMHHQPFISQSQGLTFPGMDLSQPPPGYGIPQQKSMGSPLEDGEHASSDLDERIGMRKQSSEEGGGAVVIIDSESPSDSPAHRRRRRRSPSNSRSHHRSRSDSRSRSRSKRKRSRSYEKEHEKDYDRTKDREMEKEKERDRRRKGLPPLKRNHLAVCSTTLWIGHLSKLVQQEELSDTFGEYGDIVSIDLIPPRGCAFICMNRRQDAHKALQQLRHHKLQGKAITLAWAPGKGMKGKEWKDYWEVEQGVSFIPWNKISRDIDLELLEEGGMLDEESFPEWLREKQRKIREEQQKLQNSSQAEDEKKPESHKLSGGSELDIPVPAPTLPGYIPLPDGPQPSEIKTSQAQPSIPPMMSPAPTGMPPLGMMPPFGLHNVPRLLGPMGMAMGPPGLMPNVPLGVPPPGLMGNPLMHQQIMSRMPQPVGSPFNAPPGVGLLPHPQLSQIPLPTPQSQDSSKARLNPLGPSPSGDLSSFTDSMLQLPFTLPPQLQLQAGGLGVISQRIPTIDRPSTPMDVDSDPNTSKDDGNSTPTRSLNNSVANSPFNRPPPHFSPLSLMQIPPPMNLPPSSKTNESNNSSTDKEDRESQDKDYRNYPKESNNRSTREEKERDYRSNRGKDTDYKNNRDYRDRNDKDFRDRDRDSRDRESMERSRDREYRDRDRDRRDSRRDRDRNNDDKVDSDIRNNRDFRSKDAEEGKENELKRDNKGPKNDINTRDEDDRNYKDRSRNRDRDRDRDRDRGRDRGGRWNDRDRDKEDRSRERLNQSGRDRDSGKSKDDQSDTREKSGTSLQERLRNLAHDQSRSGEFSRRGRSPVNENMILPLLPPPTAGMDPNDMNFHGPPRGPMFGSRGMGEGFGPQDLHNRHPEEFGHRGPRGSRDNFDGRGPSRGSMPPENFDARGPPPMDNFNPRGPPPDGFDPRGPPPDGFDPRGPPHEGFGPPREGFGPPRPGPPPGFNPQGSEDFHPRIRIEFFPRRGMGHPDNFMRMKGRGPMGPGQLFHPRGPPPGPMGMRGPRPGIWMDGPGFPPRGFPPPDGPPSDEFFRRSPGFEENERGRGEPNTRGMSRGRGFQAHTGEHRKEEGEGKRSRWSNASPSSPRHSQSPVNMDTSPLRTENRPTDEKSEDVSLVNINNAKITDFIDKGQEKTITDNLSAISEKPISVLELNGQERRSSTTEKEIPPIISQESLLLPKTELELSPIHEQHSSYTEGIKERRSSYTELIQNRRSSQTEPIPERRSSCTETIQERRSSYTEPIQERHSPFAKPDVTDKKHESIFPEIEDKCPILFEHEQKIPDLVKTEEKVQHSSFTEQEPYSFFEEKKPTTNPIETTYLPDQERRLSFTEQERELTLMEQEIPPEEQPFFNQNQQLSFVDDTRHSPPVQLQSFCESDFDIEPRNSDDQDFACASFPDLADDSIIPNIPSEIEMDKDEFRIEKSDHINDESVNTAESNTAPSDETNIEK